MTGGKEQGGIKMKNLYINTEVKKKVKIPENFDEFIELVGKYVKIGYFNVTIGEKRSVFVEREELREDEANIEFFEDGTIMANEYIIAEKRNVEQMWIILLNLFERELK